MNAGVKDPRAKYLVGAEAELSVNYYIDAGVEDLDGLQNKGNEESQWTPGCKIIGYITSRMPDWKIPR